MYANLVYEWEVPRKLFHCITGFVVLYLYKMNVNVEVIIQTLFNIFLVVASADLLRLNSPTFERFFESILSVLMRESEKERVNGVVWYLIGVMTSLHFFPEDIASVIRPHPRSDVCSENAHRHYPVAFLHAANR